MATSLRFMRQLDAACAHSYSRRRHGSHLYRHRVATGLLRNRVLPRLTLSLPQMRVMSRLPVTSRVSPKSMRLKPQRAEYRGSRQSPKKSKFDLASMQNPKRADCSNVGKSAPSECRRCDGSVDNALASTKNPIESLRSTTGTEAA